jgi:23S rRNA pseudouridine1911/1915/1917 synthase
VKPVSIRVPPGQTRERIDVYLAGHVENATRSKVQAAIRAGLVLVNGEPVRSSLKVSPGDRITFTPPEPPPPPGGPENIPLDIVFEDEHLIVVNKPAGMVTHPAHGHHNGTLVNALLYHCSGKLSSVNSGPAGVRPGIVHRLDKDTSGLMVVGKTLPAVTALTRAIAAREVQRHYLALVHGVPVPSAQTIEAPIGRDPVSRVRMAVVVGGKPARTDISCLASRDGISAVACRLHSGRTHQIRVHLARRGHPLVADALYGGAPALGLARQALHAARLRLRHPLQGHWLEFERALPRDLALAWAQVVTDRNR